MWKCARCSEQLEDSFDTCWKCGYSRDGSPPAQGVDDDDQSDSELFDDEPGDEVPGDEVSRADVPVANVPPLAEPLKHHAQSRTLRQSHTKQPARYRYKVAPFVGQIRRGFFSTENAATVSRQLEALIAEHAKAGWEFVSVEKIGIEVTPGCLGGLFGQRASYINFDQAVFRALA